MKPTILLAFLLLVAIGCCRKETEEERMIREIGIRVSTPEYRAQTDSILKALMNPDTAKLGPFMMGNPDGIDVLYKNNAGRTYAYVKNGVLYQGSPKENDTIK